MNLTASWQDIAAMTVGVLAVIHLAWRWWPKSARETPVAVACSHCDQGCQAKACPTEGPAEAPTRVIPASPKP